MGKYIVLEGKAFTIFTSKDQLQEYVSGKDRDWVFRSAADFPRGRGEFPSSAAIKRGTSVIICLTGGIVTPRYQEYQEGGWVV